MSQTTNRVEDYLPLFRTICILACIITSILIVAAFLLFGEGGGLFFLLSAFSASIGALAGLTGRFLKTCLTRIAELEDHLSRSTDDVIADRTT